MYWLYKLKPASIVPALGPAIIVLAAFAFVFIYWGVEAAYSYIGIVFLLFSGLSLVNFALTLNAGYIVVALFQGSAAFAFAGRYSEMFFISHRFTQLATAVLVFSLAATMYLWFTKRLKWRVREILELAARPVKDTTDGFTPRPRPGGRANCTKFELTEFAAFALKYHIAVPYYETDRIVFVAADWLQGFLRLYKLRHDYSDATWISFSYDGNVTVNIGQHEYLKFKDSFSFDQLCHSLGELFGGFLDLYRKGEGIRIIDMMNDVREHPAS
ncbi:membrane hypothetical protein [Candidatus Zixiibacteriota bacterium]|nr:membrane hypothetical protein [candidate division Zixibacteria bacterium]